MMTGIATREIFGVVGGMGPLASAEFLKTIYENNTGEREQDSPIVMLYSDPTFPPRPEAFANGEYDELLARLIEVLTRLNKLNVSQIVICCITMHYLLPRVPRDLSEKIVSLLDVVFSSVQESRKKHLMVCSNETRKWEIFESHPRWKALEEFFVLPEADDQNRIAEFILDIKMNRTDEVMIGFLEHLLHKYKTEVFIAGCTEIHVLAKQFMRSRSARDYGCVDPLAIVAKQIALSGAASKKEGRKSRA
jgi:aspartate racemase